MHYSSIINTAVKESAVCPVSSEAYHFDSLSWKKILLHYTKLSTVFTCFLQQNWIMHYKEALTK